MILHNNSGIAVVREMLTEKIYVLYLRVYENSSYFPNLIVPNALLFQSLRCTMASSGASDRLPKRIVPNGLLLRLPKRIVPNGERIFRSAPPTRSATVGSWLIGEAP